MSKRPEWAEYEALAHKIVSDLAPFATVTHNDHIVGHQSETRRQIDITVRWQDQDNDEENLMIIQVKDYKRRANVITVGEFSSVIEDVRAQRGVLICSGGFSKGAITYARNLGLFLWSLNEAKSKKWRDELTVPVLRSNYVPSLEFSGKLKTGVDNTTIPRNLSGMAARTIDGSTGEVTFTPFDISQDFLERWSRGELNIEPGIQHRLEIDLDLTIKGSRPDGSTVIHNFISPSYTYTVAKSSYVAQLKPSDYRGIRDHLDDNLFIPTEIALSTPPITDAAWTPISDPSRLAVSLRGVFFVMKDARIVGPREGVEARVTWLGPTLENDLSE